MKKAVVEYRPPQKTGLYLDGAEAALLIPLPGLVLIRTAAAGRLPSYEVYAVKKRPETLDAPLYHAPLPNVFASGAICWGRLRVSTRRRCAGRHSRATGRCCSALRSAITPFRAGKSKREPRDIRKLLITLEAKKAQRYPTGDLVPVKRTLAQVLGGDRELL